MEKAATASDVVIIGAGLAGLAAAAAAARAGAGVVILDARSPGGRARTEQVASLPADGHSSATLEIRSGTPLLDIEVANLGGTSGTLLRSSVPGDARPEITVASGGGRERSGKDELVFLSASDGASAVTVTLNAAVTWRLDFAGGTERTAADLRGGRVAGITVAAGSDIVDLALPRPRGTVPVLLFDGDATAGAARASVTRWGG
jgi:NADPH-dependent 2,4-dienoyl-CoA reductase/sulfur reductase-like enzyme